MQESTCFEIVQFSFGKNVDRARQLAYVQQLGAWVAARSGFLWRRTFRDAEHGRWTDVVAWASAEDARAAAEESVREPTLGPVMAAIDQSTLSFGHYAQVIAIDAPR